MCDEEVMKLIFSSPSLDNLIRLLKAWRFWSVGAVIGGLLGAGFYYAAPPPYRAHAVVLVNFHLEQAWPKETDRQQFYYLERETRKLEEVAYSDVVINSVAASVQNVSVEELHDGSLHLSQPAEGGWNFYVDGADADRAGTVATVWANQFANQINTQMQSAGGPESFITAQVTRGASSPFARSRSISLYIFVGAVIVLVIGSIVVLFFSGSDEPSQTSADKPDQVL